MPDLELIDGLVATYRELNHTIRPLPSATIRGRPGNDNSVYAMLVNMRDHELLFSQALKSRLTSGLGANAWNQATMPTLGLESDEDTGAMVIAQFGTARESTLAMLRDLPDEEWDATADGDKSIRTKVFELLDGDRRQMEKITGALGRN